MHATRFPSSTTTNGCGFMGESGQQYHDAERIRELERVAARLSGWQEQLEHWQHVLADVRGDAGFGRSLLLEYKERTAVSKLREAAEGIAAAKAAAAELYRLGHRT